MDYKELIKKELEKVEDKEITLELLNEIFNLNFFSNSYIVGKPNIICTRGSKYFTGKRVISYEQEDNIINLKIEGTKDYNIKLVIDKKNESLIKNITCDCPYYKEKYYCKHTCAASNEYYYRHNIKEKKKLYTILYDIFNKTYSYLEKIEISKYDKINIKNEIDTYIVYEESRLSRATHLYDIAKNIKKKILDLITEENLYKYKINKLLEEDYSKDKLKECLNLKIEILSKNKNVNLTKLDDEIKYLIEYNSLCNREEKINELKSLEDILKNKYLKTEYKYAQKIINKNSPITKTTISRMDKEDLEDMHSIYNLDLELLLTLKYYSLKHQVNNQTINDINENIKIKVNEVNC